MASDVEDTLPSTWQIAWSLGHLIPYVAMLSFALGIVIPAAPYVSMNFFAQSHTNLEPEEIHCEDVTLSTYCRAAIRDATTVLMVLGAICPVTQFVMLPAMGALSDEMGRWKLAAASHLLGLCSGLAILSFVLFNTSMYWYFIWLPFTSNPITHISWGTVAFNAMVTDLLEQPEARSAGIGLLQAVGALFMILGNLSGAFLSIKGAVIASVGIYLVDLCYLVMLVPETFPAEKRKRVLTWRTLLPGVELGILFRTSAMRLLSCVIILSGLVDAGFDRILPMYLQWTLNWSADWNYIDEIARSVAIFICLGLIFRPLVMRIGDVGMLVVGRLAGVLACMLVLLASRPWQIVGVTLFSSGAVAFCIPAISGLKSSLVGAEDQGAMQGALNTVFSIASSVGVFIFGGLFSHMNRKLVQAPPTSEQGAVNKSVFVMGIVASLPLLWLISLIPGAMRSDAALAGELPCGAPEAEGRPPGAGGKARAAPGSERESGGRYGSLA